MGSLGASQAGLGRCWALRALASDVATPSLGHILGHHCGIQWSKDILKVIASIRVVDPVCEQWPEKSLVVKCQISELNVVWSPLLVPSMDNGQKYSLVQGVTDTGIDQGRLCDKVIELHHTTQIANMEEK